MEENFIINGLSNKQFDHQKVGIYLMELYNANDKQLTPSLVVMDSKREDSPLHNYFEWNDKKAANEWRLQQARVIIGQVDVIKISGDEQFTVRAFSHIRKDLEGNLTLNPFNKGESYYMATVDAFQSEPFKKYTLAMAMQDFKVFKNKYNHLIELGKVFEVAEKIKVS